MKKITEKKSTRRTFLRQSAVATTGVTAGLKALGAPSKVSAQGASDRIRIGFIGVGIRNGGDGPLDSNANLSHIVLPVLDVYGDGGDGVDVKHAQTRSNMVSDRYKQVLIPNASHTFDDHEGEMLNAVIDWLSEKEKQ